MKRAGVVIVVAMLALGLVVGGGGLVVLLAGGSGDDGGGAPVKVVRPDAGEAGPVRTAPDPALAAFYDQEPAWRSCGSDECATLTVPLDYAAPSGATIELPLLRVRARERSVGSLVVNPGGPGASGVEYAKAAARVFRRPLTDNYDVVGFDPRGTGEGEPRIDCLTDPELDAFLAQDPDPDTPAEVDAYVEWSTRLARGCAARSGDLAGHVSTAEAARDMDILRAALGERRLSYFGASYGTKLGATYADLFPARVGRFVLDGAVDLSVDSRTLSLQQAQGFETALRAYVANCVETTDSCFLGDSVAAGLARIKRLLAGIEQEPLPTDGSRDLAIGNAFYGIVAPLYNRDYWVLLSTALRTAFNGDGSTLLELSDLYSSREGSGYRDNSAEAIYAINCLDDSYSVPATRIPAQLPAFEKVSPTFGDVFAWGLVSCEGFPRRPERHAPAVLAEGAAPILVVGTTRDPATPYVWAQHLAAQLDSGVLLTRDGDGHTGYNSGNACADTTIEAYLLAGDVPADGKRC